MYTPHPLSTHSPVLSFLAIHALIRQLSAPFPSSESLSHSLSLCLLVCSFRLLVCLAVSLWDDLCQAWPAIDARFQFSLPASARDSHEWRVEVYFRENETRLELVRRSESSDTDRLIRTSVKDFSRPSFGRDMARRRAIGSLKKKRKRENYPSNRVQSPIARPSGTLRGTLTN